MLSRIEKQLKRRFAIGSQVSEHSIVQDFTKQVGLCWVWQGRGGCPQPRSHPPTPVSSCLAKGPSWGGCCSSQTRSCHASPWDCFSLG